MKKTIRAIISGSPYSADSCSSIKRHIKKAMFEASNFLPSYSPTDHIISFHENEAIKLCQPHNDAFVISLLIANCHVHHILVNNGSSADIFFLSGLQEMDINVTNEPQGSVITTSSNSNNATYSNYRWQTNRGMGYP